LAVSPVSRISGLHRLAGAFHHLGPAQKGRPDAESPGADVPELAGFLDLDHAVALQRDQRAEDGGDRLAGVFGDFRQGAAGVGGDMGQNLQPPVQRLHGVLVGLVVEGLRAGRGVSLHHLICLLGREKAQAIDIREFSTPQRK
jgi:hypothetical protein